MPRRLHSPGDAPSSAGRFLLYSRVDCHLCEQMLEDLAALPMASAYPVDVVDVDADPEARLRYGHKVPVLMFADEMVCHGRLDADEVHKTLAHHRRPV
jgi:Glutaredoxin-like domain (DUF836)